MKLIISVVVNCFNRRDYLMEALKSACEQTIPKSEYEIILIKNFHDGEIDNFADQNGITNIYTEKVTTGSWFEIASNTAKGDFISFLDDDDLMRPDKLHIIKSIIRLGAGIEYIHNKSTRVNSSFQAIEYDSEKIIYIEPYNRRNFRKALKNKYYFNLSSITVKNNILKDHLPFIRITNHGTDFVIFSAAYASRKKMIEYDDNLTFYRVHIDSHGNYKANSIGEFETMKMSVLPSYLNHWQLISGFRNGGVLGEYAKLRFLTTKIWLNLVSPKPVYKIGFSEIIDNLGGVAIYPLFVPFIAVYYFDRSFHRATKKVYYMVIYSWVGWKLRENI